MNIEINHELTNINIDILAKAGVKKSTVNKMHKLKVKTIGDIKNVDIGVFEQLMLEDSGLKLGQINDLLKLSLFDFTKKVFTCLKEDPIYHIVMLHIANHTHNEIAQKNGMSKEKVKQSISKFLQGLFTLVDALGIKMIANKPYIGVEELEELFDSEDDYKLLLLAFKAHSTKWLYHTDAECFTSIKMVTK